MTNITNKCIRMVLMSLVAVTLSSMPASAQHQQTENLSEDPGLIGQFEFLKQIGGQELTAGKDNGQRPLLLSNGTDHSDNSRWSGEFGEAYVQQVVITAKEHSGELYLMGDIHTASNGEVVTPASGIVKWDGESYHSFPGELNGPVNDVAFIDSDMFIVGGFTTVTVDGIETELNHIAKWDGEAWSSLGDGTDGEVYTLLAVNNTLYVAGNFTTSDGDQVSSPYIARWSENSESWNSLSGISLNNAVQTIETDGSNIYAGGNFDNDNLKGIAKWDGTDWEPLGEGLNNVVTDIQLHGDQIYASGNFEERGDGTSLRYVGVYDLSADEEDRQWESPAQSSPDGIAYRMNIFNDELYISGGFQNIGINEIKGVAKLENGQWQPVGNGIDGLVVTLAHMPDGTLYAGGIFEEEYGMASPNFAVFQDNEWQPVGNGEKTGLSVGQLLDNAGVLDIKWYEGDLYVAGLFDEIGGVETNGIARWDGVSWHDVDGGLRVEDGDYQPAGSSLHVQNGNLYVAGQFDRAGSLAQPANNIARWDGEEWSRLGNGVSDSPQGIPYIWQMTETNGNIYVAGDFTDATGVPVNNIAYWDGTDWFDLGNGTGSGNDVVRGLHIEGDQFYISGQFSTVGSTEELVDANNVAVWSETNQEWSALGDGFTQALFDITRYNGTLLVGGAFENQGGSGDVSALSAWNESAGVWEDYQDAGIETGSAVVDIEVVDETLYIAGIFNSVNGQENMNNIASYSADEGWNPLGTGISTIGDETSLIYNLREEEGSLWVSGIFTQAGNRSAHGISSWDLQLGVSVDEPVTESPEQFQLNQNYPNPFNPVTTIRFELEEPAAVTLQVFDMLGREVATIVENQLSSGSHHVSFDASGLSSGVYLYRLEAMSGSGQAFAQSRKMTLIK